MNIRAASAAVALVGCVALANWTTSQFGLVAAGFGLTAAAGTYAAGLALAFRDALHEAGGIHWVLGAVVAGIFLSLLLGDGRIALASAVAFGIAELLDLAVYTPLRKRRWRAAVASSNAVGSVADTVAFLTISGLGLSGQTIPGQLLIKAVWTTALFLAVVEVGRLVRARTRAVAM